MPLTVILSSRISPRASTSIVCDKSPTATACCNEKGRESLQRRRKRKSRVQGTDLGDLGDGSYLTCEVGSEFLDDRQAKLAPCTSKIIRRMELTLTTAVRSLHVPWTPSTTACQEPPSQHKADSQALRKKEEDSYLTTKLALRSDLQTDPLHLSSEQRQVVDPDCTKSKRSISFPDPPSASTPKQGGTHMVLMMSLSSIMTIPSTGTMIFCVRSPAAT